MNKLIIFDMDGTIADLYGVENWLDYLLAEDSMPYTIANPLVDMEELVKVLNELRAIGYTIAVTSSSISTRGFAIVREAKKEWLARYNFPADEIHLVKYGATKANSTRHHKCEQILFDDNAKVRAGWHLGPAYDVDNILETLYSFLT